MKHNVFERNSSISPFDVSNPPEVKEQVKIIQDIIENQPPNKFFDWNIDLYSDLGEIKVLAIDDYCENCGTTKVFNNINPIIMDEEFDKNVGYKPSYAPVDGVDIPLPNPNEDFKTKQYILGIKLKCAKCGEMHYYFLLFKGEKIIKIGQYPSFAGKEKHELDKYKNIISKYYIELVRSVNAYSQNMGIAAFVYLRRIYEHIVETEYAKFPEPEKNANASFDEKMKEVDKRVHIIPFELDAHKSKIYSVLSKGIHEYEEDECYEMYPMMKTIIIIMLDKYLAEKEKRKQLKELNKFLNSK